MVRSMLEVRGRLAAVGLLALATSMVWVSSAGATVLVNGVCTLDMTFTFSSSPTLLGSSPGYTISVNETNSGCTLDTLDEIPVDASGSAAAGSGGTSLAKCSVLAGVGPWNQSFEGKAPAVFDGSHVVSGTWEGATMVVTGYPGHALTYFTGVIELVPHPSEPLVNAGKTNTCVNGGSVLSIRMLGVQVFNDP